MDDEKQCLNDNEYVKSIANQPALYNICFRKQTNLLKYVHEI